MNALAAPTRESLIYSPVVLLTLENQLYMNSRLPESLALEGFPTGGRPPNPELEDCRRVLTTSRGHVRMAPVVPPILKRGKTDRFMVKDQNFYPTGIFFKFLFFTT